MVFHWSFSDSKSPQVSRTHLRMLAVLSNAVVWIVSTRPPTSKSSRPFDNPLVIVPNAPITIGTIVTFMFHSFFNSLARSRNLSFFSLSFRFILWSAGLTRFWQASILKQENTFNYTAMQSFVSKLPSSVKRKKKKWSPSSRRFFLICLKLLASFIWLLSRTNWLKYFFLLFLSEFHYMKKMFPFMYLRLVSMFHGHYAQCNG